MYVYNWLVSLMVIFFVVDEDVDMDTTNETVTKPPPPFIKRFSSGYSSTMSMSSMSQSLGECSTTEGIL